MAAFEPPEAGDRSGFSTRWQNLAAALGNYVKARLGLFAEETRVVGRAVVGSIVLLLLAGVAALVAWLLVVVATVCLLVSHLEWSVATSAGIVAGGHAAIALIMLVMARARLSRSDQWFVHTRDEFEHDLESAARKTAEADPGKPS